MRFLTFLSFTAIVLSVRCQEWQVWDMGNSPLPSTTVKALAEDGLGGIWVGTDWGLCHFDGAEDWEVFQIANSPLPTNDIEVVVVDAQQRVWAATTGGLVMKDGEDWSVFTIENSAIPESAARGLFVDHLDRLWIATSGGLARVSGNEWVIYDNTPESHGGLVLNTANTRCVSVRPDGLVCLGTFNGGLHFLTETSVSFLTTFNDGFFDNTANGVLFDPVNGDRWVATPSAGLLRQQGPAEGGVWFQWNSSIEFPSNGLTCLDMDPERRVWVGTQISGVVRVEQDGTFIQFAQTGDGLPDNEVRSVLAADDGSVWVGTTYGGLARYTETVAIREAQKQIRIAVSPNPVRTWATVEIVEGRNEGVSWSLFGPRGEFLRSGRGFGSRFQLSAQGLSAGLHLLKVTNGAFVETIRLIVEE